MGHHTVCRDGSRHADDTRPAAAAALPCQALWAWQVAGSSCLATVMGMLFLISAGVVRESVRSCCLACQGVLDEVRLGGIWQQQ